MTQCMPPTTIPEIVRSFFKVFILPFSPNTTLAHYRLPGRRILRTWIGLGRWPRAPDGKTEKHGQAVMILSRSFRLLEDLFEDVVAFRTKPNEGAEDQGFDQGPDRPSGRTTTLYPATPFLSGVE